MKKAHWIVPGFFFPILLWAGQDLGLSNSTQMGPNDGAATVPSISIEDHIQLFTFQTHSRLSLRIDESIPLDWKNTSQGFELTLKGVGLMDLGAPLGEEDRWRAQFKAVDDIRLGGLEIQEISGGLKIFGKWKFPKGALALAYPAMEVFDFHDKNPPRYVIDFWIKAGPTIAEVKEIRHRRLLLASIQKAQSEEKKRISRKIASIKRHRDEIENSRKFCEEPLSEANDVFLQFYPLHQPMDFSRWFTGTTADSDFIYFRPKKRNKEAQYIRLALDFYSQGNPALTLRTLDFFDNEFPRSDSQTEMKFLRANSLLKLAMNVEGEQILSHLMEDTKDSVVSLHSAMYLAGRLMEKNLPLAAMEKFLWLIRHYPDNGLNWVFHMGAAECLFVMKQTERAAKEYQWVMENGPDSKAKAEAASRIGDLFLARFQYEQALGAYSQGYRYFPEQTKKFPALFLNWGESLYQLGQYSRAKETFSKFLENYPTHPGGWRATFRLGEISARTSKQGLNSEEARKWFYETINFYPFSSGGTLARIRLLPCGDHGGFNMEAQERFFSLEAKSFASNPTGAKEVLMKNYEDFRALARIRTLVALGSQDQTATVAMQEIHTVRNPLLKKTLTAAANEYFRKTLLGLLAEGKRFEALSVYSVKAPLMPPADAGSPSDYLLQLSRAAADYGLGGMAEELSKTYEKAEALKHQEASRVLASAKISNGLVQKASVPPSEPSDEETVADTESQLKISEQSFTEAKALWISTKDLPQSTSFSRVRSLLDLVLDESPFSYEKELILGLLDEKESKLQSALGHISRAQLLNNNARINAWLASLESRLGDGKAAFDLYSNLEKRLSLKEAQKTEVSSAKSAKESAKDTVEDILGVPFLPSLESVLLTEAEIQELRGQWGEASSTYSRAIEKGWGGSQVEYQYARSLIKLGGSSQKVKARNILEKLANGQTKGESEEFWKKLAFETLTNMPRRGKNE